MTDVQMTCSKCGKVIRVSQYVKADSLTCPACGTPIQRIMDGTVPKPGHKKLRLREKPAEFKTTETTKDDSEWGYHEMMDKLPQHDEKRQHLKHVWLSILVFLVLGGGAYLLRYHEACAPVVPYISAFGPYTLILIWISCTLIAFKDDILQGILCLLIPFYWVYYLFLVLDWFYLRAIVAAVLIAVAVDSYAFYSVWAAETYERANTWIMQGGGELRTHRKEAEDAARKKRR